MGVCSRGGRRQGVGKEGVNQCTINVCVHNRPMSSGGVLVVVQRCVACDCCGLCGHGAPLLRSAAPPAGNTSLLSPLCAPTTFSRLAVKAACASLCCCCDAARSAGSGARGGRQGNAVQSGAWCGNGQLQCLAVRPRDARCMLLAGASCLAWPQAGDAQRCRGRAQQLTNLVTAACWCSIKTRPQHACQFLLPSHSHEAAQLLHTHLRWRVQQGCQQSQLQQP